MKILLIVFLSAIYFFMFCVTFSIIRIKMGGKNIKLSHDEDIFYYLFGGLFWPLTLTVMIIFKAFSNLIDKTTGWIS